MAEAIVMLLLNTGLRVDELVTLTWEGVHLQAHSGWIDVVGKGDKHRRLPLNAEARNSLEAIQPLPVDHVGGAVFLGKRGPYTARGIEYLVAELGRRAQRPECAPASLSPRHRAAPGRVGRPAHRDQGGRGKRGGTLSCRIAEARHLNRP